MCLGCLYRLGVSSRPVQWPTRFRRAMTDVDIFKLVILTDAVSISNTQYFEDWGTRDRKASILDTAGLEYASELCLIYPLRFQVRDWISAPI